MRLMELIQDPLTARIKDAIGVMVARSKTTGEPYEISYEQLADMMDFPGPVGAAELERAMNDDPSLASIISDFDGSSFQVDANTTEKPEDLANIGLPPGMDAMGAPGAPVPGMDAMGAPGAPVPGMDAMGAPGAPVPAPIPTADPQMDVTPAATVDQMAARARKRRGL